jgi:alpha-ketoglutarate-dependent taurine dioxygenase
MTPTIGGMISGVDLNNTRSEDVYEEIKQALWQHGVVFFRKQALKPEAYIRLGQNFGEMEQHEFFPHIEGHPQIQLISNQGNEAPETDRWHTDVTFRKKPNMVSILRITDCPPRAATPCGCTRVLRTTRSTPACNKCSKACRPTTICPGTSAESMPTSVWPSGLRPRAA